MTKELSRPEMVGEYLVNHHATIRQCANHFGLSKSTIHLDCSVRLKKVNSLLYENVKAILEINLAERHLRGGKSTKEKYLNNKKKDVKNN